MIYCGKECSFIPFLIVIIGIPVTPSKDYRKDYTYNDKTDAYYKFHIESSSLEQAKSVCELEGASLIIPTSDHDVSQVHGMFKRYPDLGNHVWIGNDGNEHESAEEEPIIDLEEDNTDTKFPTNLKKCNVMTRDGDVRTTACYRQLPFVCKVNSQDVYYDPHCMVYGKGYQYFQNVSSCYKLPTIPYSWNQAYEECRSEGAHLLVLNSEKERRVIRRFINSEPLVSGAKATYFFFVGIRAARKTDGSPVVFKTIFNQTLEKAGFNQWAPNEPNNHLNSEYCGTIFIQDAKYNDVDCSHLYGFICENEVTNT